MHRVCIYYGKETELIRPELPHTARVVLTLMEGLHHKRYDLYMDRFYTSPAIATEAPRNWCNSYRYELYHLPYIYFLIQPGTVQSNRKGVPTEFKSKAKKPASTVEAFRDGDIMALAWTDKRNVLMLSTKHAANTVSVQSRYMTL